MKQSKKNKEEIILAMKEISRIKGIDEDLLFTALEDALTAAYRKNYNDTASQEIKSLVNRETGEIKILNLRKVVEEVEDETAQIALEDARKVKPSCELGDVVEEDVTPENFMRVAAQNAKQIVTQRIKEAERSIIYNEFSEKEFDLISGIIQRKDKGNVYIDLGKIEAVLGPSEQIPGETYEFNQRVDLYIVEVRQNTKGPLITVSRTHPGLVRRLFEREVPEIYSGVVEIKSISREPGSRSKIAVHSNDENVDATGACVGNRGIRVQNVVAELKNEKIDIVQWDKDPAAYIANALSPAKTEAVTVNPNDNTARVIVDETQLSLAIGKEGQNVRLAAKLTGWKIDIKSSRDPQAMAGFEAFAENTYRPGKPRREVAKEHLADVSSEHLKDVSPEHLKDVSSEHLKDVPEHIAEVPVELPEEISKESSVEVPEEHIVEVPEEQSVEVPEELPVEVPLEESK